MTNYIKTLPVHRIFSKSRGISSTIWLNAVQVQALNRHTGWQRSRRRFLFSNHREVCTMLFAVMSNGIGPSNVMLVVCHVRDKRLPWHWYLPNLTICSRADGCQHLISFRYFPFCFINFGFVKCRHFAFRYSFVFTRSSRRSQWWQQQRQQNTFVAIISN